MIGKPAANLRQGHVRHRRHPVQNPVAMDLDPMRAVVAPLLVRFDRPRAAIVVVQLGNETRAHPKLGRNSSDRTAADNFTNNTRA